MPINGCGRRKIIIMKSTKILWSVIVCLVLSLSVSILANIGIINLSTIFKSSITTENVEKVLQLSDIEMTLDREWSLPKSSAVVKLDFKVKNISKEPQTIYQTNLSIFDYLVSNYDVVDKANRDNFKTVYLAGNLSEAKSRYVYELPKLEFSSYIIELFGVNYTGISNEYIHYNGAVKPEELPKNIFTGFGLVWDGDSLDTCTGNLGNYLKFNNPHKLSSYIACGIPVIVWKEAAISDFVTENKIGFSIQNLKEIDSILKYLSYDDYIKMKGNVLSIRENIITGSYLKNTVLEIEEE